MKAVYGLPISDTTKSELRFTPEHVIRLSGKELQVLWLFFCTGISGLPMLKEEIREAMKVYTKVTKGF